MNQANVQANEGSHPTKDKILDAAQQLFSEHGFDATSLRMITSEAGVNLAAVNYHFHSKEALVQAVFARRLGPLNRERLRLLDECEAAAGDKLPSLDGIIRAFVEPVLRYPEGGNRGAQEFRQLMGRMYVEPSDAVRSIVLEQMRETARRFTLAFRRVLPGLPQVELLWRVHFGIGALAHTMAGCYLLKNLSGGLCDPTDVKGAVERLVAFLAAGLRAPLREISEQG